MIQIFGLLVVLQFVLICVHDLVDVPGWTHGKQVQEVIGRRKLWLVTAINAIFPGIAAAMAVAYWGQRAPRLVSGYWFLYFAITVGSAIAMWYIPYFFGASEQQHFFEQPRGVARFRHDLFK